MVWLGYNLWRLLYSNTFIYLTFILALYLFCLDKLSLFVTTTKIKTLEHLCALCDTPSATCPRRSSILSLRSPGNVKMSRRDITWRHAITSKLKIWSNHKFEASTFWKQEAETNTQVLPSYYTFKYPFLPLITCHLLKFRQMKPYTRYALKTPHIISLIFFFGRSIDKAPRSQWNVPTNIFDYVTLTCDLDLWTWPRYPFIRPPCQNSKFKSKRLSVWQWEW